MCLPTNLSKMVGFSLVIFFFFIDDNILAYPCYRNIRYIIECKDTIKYKNMKFIPVISTLQEIIKYYYHKDGKSRFKKFLRLKTLPK